MSQQRGVNHEVIALPPPSHQPTHASVASRRETPPSSLALLSNRRSTTPKRLAIDGESEVEARLDPVAYPTAVDRTVATAHSRGVVGAGAPPQRTSLRMSTSPWAQLILGGQIHVANDHRSGYPTSAPSMREGHRPQCRSAMLAQRRADSQARSVAGLEAAFQDSPAVVGAKKYYYNSNQAAYQASTLVPRAKNEEKAEEETRPISDATTQPNSSRHHREAKDRDIRDRRTADSSTCVHHRQLAEAGVPATDGPTHATIHRERRDSAIVHEREESQPRHATATRVKSCAPPEPVGLHVAETLVYDDSPPRRSVVSVETNRSTDPNTAGPSSDDAAAAEGQPALSEPPTNRSSTPGRRAKRFVPAPTPANQPTTRRIYRPSDGSADRPEWNRGRDAAVTHVLGWHQNPSHVFDFCQSDRPAAVAGVDRVVSRLESARAVHSDSVVTTQGGAMQPPQGRRCAFTPRNTQALLDWQW
jgi:hypothetical protein